MKPTLHLVERFEDFERTTLASRVARPAIPAGTVQSSVTVLRVLTPGVEPAMHLLAQVRAAWRPAAWG